MFDEAFSLWGSATSWLEVVAFVLSLAMVGCNIRELIWGWPLAALSSALYSLLFWEQKLYGEASLQWVFVAVTAWGWWQWRRGALGDVAIRVHRLSAQGLRHVVVVSLLAWPVLALLLRRFTDSDVPWLDGFTTALSLVGQYLLGRKAIENWAVWLIVNVVSVALFAVKGLGLTVLLYALFAALSLVGWRAWAQTLRKTP